MDKYKEEYEKSIFSSKVKKLLPREIERFNVKEYETFFTSDILEAIYFFDLFLKTQTRHESFLKSFYSSNYRVVNDLMKCVFIHAGSRNISYINVIHEMVLFEAIDILPNPEDLTDEDLSLLIYITNNRIIEVFNNTIKLSTEKVPYLYKAILDDSFEYITRHIEHKLQDARKELPQLLNDAENINDYIDRFSAKVQDIFTTKHILSNFNSNNHGFSFIKNVPLEIFEEKIVYKNFSDALIDGFVDMYLLSIYANRDGRNLIEKYVENKDSAKRDTILKFQMFIAQNKSNAKHIPFKYLSKNLSLSENEITKLSRFILGFKSDNLLEKLDNLILYSHL